MSVTAIITNHDYGCYLAECLSTTTRYCDEVLLYDDGSTDDSLEVAAAYPEVKVTHRPDMSGSPVWGSNLGIEQATSDRLVFVDADNFLIGPPPVTEADYTFAAIALVDARGRQTRVRRYPDWPLEADACFAKFTDAALAGIPMMPMPSGGVYLTKWVRGLRWRAWDSMALATDMRTAIDWCKERPTLAYSPVPFLAFRQHPRQRTNAIDRPKVAAEVMRVALTEGMPAG